MDRASIYRFSRLAPQIMSLLALTVRDWLGRSWREHHQHEGFLGPHLPTEHGCTDPVYYNFLQRNDASKVSTKRSSSSLQIALCMGTTTNAAGARVKWMFTTDKARAKMGRAYLVTSKESSTLWRDTSWVWSCARSPAVDARDPPPASWLGPGPARRAARYRPQPLRRPAMLLRRCPSGKWLELGVAHSPGT
jgi:hypothetical protein